MHIVIVGPGALGCLLASLLQRGITETDTITLLDHNAERTALLNSRGVLYEKDKVTSRFILPAFSDPSVIQPPDALLICVKSYDIEKTLAFCAPLLNANTLLVFLQNGIAHLQHQTHSQKTAAAFAITTEGSTNLAPGHVRHAGVGRTFLGFLASPDKEQRQRLSQLVTVLQKGGLEACETGSILSRIWTKLLINVGINALTAVHDCTNGELLQNPLIKMQMQQAIAEAVEVARCENIQIRAPVQNAENVCRTTAENISSMLQDVRRKRKTEIDAINGAIAVKAENYGLSTPVNTFLVQRIKEIERSYEKHHHHT
jgi:2-dehydropantoate 2-reductase